jgi:phospholipase A2
MQGDEAIDQVEQDIRTYRLEKDYMQLRRDLVVMPALQRLCPGARRPINIAIVASGGGSRAMFTTFGALRGLVDLGVFDATSYVCGLSGSTWALSMLYNEVNKERGTKNIREALRDVIFGAVQQAPNFNFFTQAIVKAAVRPASAQVFSPSAAIQVKETFNQPITNTDYYGSSIARFLLEKTNIYEQAYKPDYLSLHLGEDARWQGKNQGLSRSCYPHLPFPIYTAVSPLNNVEPRLFPWFEFTPYQVGAVIGSGNDQHGMFVKSWSFGRNFEHGHSADYAPEQALEFYLGVFSSAMNSSAKETLSMAMSRKRIETVKSWLDWMLEQSDKFL